MPTKSIHKKYRKDFLEQVIVRVDFDTPLPIDSTGPAKEIYTTIKERFPLTEERKIQGKEFIVGPKIAKTRDVEKREWRYFGKDREKNLTFAENCMFIEYHKYEFYETLREDFLTMLGALYSSYSRLQITRLGLRYINNIVLENGNPTNWEKYLKPELTSIFSLTDDKKKIARAFHILEFNYGEDFLRFQFGMINPDYPAPIKKKAYVLDYDMSLTRLIDRADIEQSLDRFHEIINNSFEEVILPELRKIMGLINE